MKKNIFLLTETLPDDKVRKLEYVKGSLIDALCVLRSDAFDKAKGGHCGTYPRNKHLNEAVEEGFAKDGLSWTSRSGLTLELKQIA